MNKRGQFVNVQPKKVSLIVLLAYLILGGYFINYRFQWFPIPEAFAQFDPWVIFAGGVLMVFGAINYFRLKKS